MNEKTTRIFATHSTVIDRTDISIIYAMWRGEGSEIQLIPLHSHYQIQLKIIWQNLDKRRTQYFYTLKEIWSHWIKNPDHLRSAICSLHEEAHKFTCSWYHETLQFKDKQNKSQCIFDHKIVVIAKLLEIQLNYSTKWFIKFISWVGLPTNLLSRWSRYEGAIPQKDI